MPNPKKSIKFRFCFQLGGDGGRVLDTRTKGWEEAKPSIAPSLFRPASPHSLW